jgi:hypothetical protein
MNRDLLKTKEPGNADIGGRAVRNDGMKRYRGENSTDRESTRANPQQMVLLRDANLQNYIRVLQLDNRFQQRL